MKHILLLLTAMVVIPAHAGRIICENKSYNALDGENAALETVDALEIVGVLDAEGLLDVRKDQDSMATITSKQHNINICRGFNIDPNQNPQGMNKGWKEAKLNSSNYRIRLVRDQETGTVQAVAATPSTRITFRNCIYEKSEGDDEAVKAMFDELKDISEDPEMVKGSEDSKAKYEADEKASMDSSTSAAGAVR